MAEDFRNQHIDFRNERYQTVRACIPNQACNAYPVYLMSMLEHADPGVESVLLQVRELGRGNFGVTMLMQDLQTSEYVAAKFIQRGAKVGTICRDCGIKRLHTRV
jgi:hypothetical protein